MDEDQEDISLDQGEDDDDAADDPSARQERYEMLQESGRQYRFQPGQSGNPAGRPPKSRQRIVAQMISELWEKPCGLKAFRGKTWGEAYGEALYIHAIARGRARPIQEISERLDGKVPLPIKLAMTEDYQSASSLTITVVESNSAPLNDVIPPMKVIEATVGAAALETRST